MIRSLIAFSALLLFVAPLTADPACPCVPVSHLWTVRSCDTFDCAASEFMLSKGSADYMVVPTGGTDVKWVVLERVPSGTATSSDPAFTLEAFDDLDGASTRFATVDPRLSPMILSATDGKFLIVARQMPEPRRRATAH
jgi:hypothetical protein